MKTLYMHDPVQGHDIIKRAWSFAKCQLEAGMKLEVRIVEQRKHRIQEERYHAMIGDVAKQVEHIGRKWHADDMKRILVDEFAEEMRIAGSPLRHDSRVTPSFDGRRIVQLGIQTREFTVKEASAFIEFLFAFGAERDVVWSDPTQEA